MVCQKNKKILSTDGILPFLMLLYQISLLLKTLIHSIGPLVLALPVLQLHLL
jgi:hypothetical protein